MDKKFIRSCVMAFANFLKKQGFDFNKPPVRAIPLPLTGFAQGIAGLRNVRRLQFSHAPAIRPRPSCSIAILSRCAAPVMSLVMTNDVAPSSERSSKSCRR